MSESQVRPSPDSLVRAVIERWRNGEPPNARAFLEAHPEIQQRKTLAVDLIYEEFCLRQEQGETCVASTFCNRFPAYKQSLARMLDVHSFMAGAGASGPIAWPEPGSTFLGFEIVEQIGAGAVAKVYLAREIDVGGRQVVIKVSRFGRGEARLLGKLTHPGVVPIHSVREDHETGMTCICMPFLGTATLVDILDEAFPLGSPPTSARLIGQLALGYLPAGIDPAAWGPVDPFYSAATYEEGIVHLGRQIVTALSKAHQAGITHRDIKPSNVLLSRDGRPMLLDFNLSIEEQLPADRVGGTLAYMAPEQLEVFSGSLPDCAHDPRSDLYSVGAMLFELLTGKLHSRPADRPGKPPTLADWIKCRRGAPPSVREHNPAVGRALDAILQRALAPRPGDRYGSADELAAELAALLRPRARLMRKIRDRRHWIIAGGGLLAAAGLAGGWYVATLPPLPVRLYEAGLQAFDRGEFADAEELFTQSIKAGNDSIEVYFARGQTRRQLKDTDGEDDDFGRAALRDKGQYNIALLYGAQAGDDCQRPQQAQSFLIQAQYKGWDTVRVANSLGIALSRLGYPEVGVKQFDRILAQYPANDTARYNRARCWLHRIVSVQSIADLLQPIEDAKALAEKDPSDRESLGIVARLLTRAAYLDKNYDGEARKYLLLVESRGEPRTDTIHWWRTFTNQIPPPPAAVDRNLQPLTLPWRKTPAPTDPRLNRCIPILKSELWLKK